MSNPFLIILETIKNLFHGIKENFDNGVQPGQLLGKEAIDLLSDDKTRHEFIEFISDKNNVEQKERTKTFEKKNGEKVTIITYS
ncbi:hypothetical protein [Flavobacterium sp.]|uniref:hypothetical protein n=1 Tax=Flavobacterium sp. TaxID=239 RepID=UPI00391DF829